MHEGPPPQSYRVIEAYRRFNADPIVLWKGDPVTVGPFYQDDPEGPGWIWCEHTVGQGGWVPEALIKSSGATGKALGSFKARELDVEADEAVMVSKILNGWA